ncbi:hypothetical protein GALMADRAFT_221910 [Galerina marginata CBS 339.88]|uniref:Uncharacterized protein n=1 Tax=Galerina marginata (strain CBS 339.88) TaxID=685588 RepID=A0A067TFW6_GALM3|nr:hypothetical protein GALMADRAFT_221910 [Galerina marginata CBS 339.88]
MFAKPSFLFTLVLGFLFALLSLPSVSALPAPVPAPAALPAVVVLPVQARASNPTSLLGRRYHANPNVARAASPDGPEGPIMVLRAADTGAVLEPIKRAERFQLRMERARRLA